MPIPQKAYLLRFLLAPRQTATISLLLQVSAFLYPAHPFFHRLQAIQLIIAAIIVLISVLFAAHQPSLLTPDRKTINLTFDQQNILYYGANSILRSLREHPELSENSVYLPQLVATSLAIEYARGMPLTRKAVDHNLSRPTRTPSLMYLYYFLTYYASRTQQLDVSTGEPTSYHLIPEDMAWIQTTTQHLAQRIPRHTHEIVNTQHDSEAHSLAAAILLTTIEHFSQTSNRDRLIEAFLLARLLLQTYHAQQSDFRIPIQ